MKKGKVIILAISLIISGIISYSFFQYYSISDYYPNKLKIEFDVAVPDYDKAELFFENNDKFSENYKSLYGFPHIQDHYVLSFEVPELLNPGKIRFDPGSKRGKWRIYSMRFTGIHQEYNFTAAEVFQLFDPAKHIKNYTLNKEFISFETTDTDPTLLSRYSFEHWYKKLNTPAKIPRGVYILTFFTFIFLVFSLTILFNKIQLNKFGYKHVTISLFLVIIILPGIQFMITRKKQKSSAANLVYDKPNYDGRNLKKYIKQYAQYFETNYGFRQELFMLNGYYKLKLFHSSSRPQKVSVGNNGWVFYTDSLVWGDYQNKVLYTDHQLEKIKNNLEELHTWHKNRGIDFYITIFPNKANIYPECLPYNIPQLSGISKIDQLRDYLYKNSYVHIIDVKPALLEKKKKAQIYFPGDTHWNHEGAFTAYEVIIDTLKNKYPQIFKIRSDNVPRIYGYTDGGDLYAQLGIDKIYKNEEYRPVYDLLAKSYTDYTHEYGSQNIIMPSFRAAQADTTLPKIVVYRDSFFGFMQPYFSEGFRECMYVWSTELSKETIEGEDPDIVLYSMIGGNIDRLLQDNPEEIKKSINPQ